MVEAAKAPEYLVHGSMQPQTDQIAISDQRVSPKATNIVCSQNTQTETM